MGNILVEKFGVPPFSVLDTKQGYWQDRKRHWQLMGIKSEIGRDAECLPGGFDEEKYGKKQSEGTSIFDPVLCEMCYKWFLPKDGSILDPFAGGSVRGIIAGVMDHSYLGLELSEKQVFANREQKEELIKDKDVTWIVGDSNQSLDNISNNSYDLIFSCPPYFNLEVYSDDKDDLSNKDYNGFLNLYESIIKKSLQKLKNNRFAIFTVGDVRDKNGFYVNFVEDTVRLFEKHGAKKYNEIILLKSIGTLPLRVSAQFPSGRKVGKAHENVLVFYKGDPKQIKTEFETFEYKPDISRSIFDFDEDKPIVEEKDIEIEKPKPMFDDEFN